MPCLMLWRSTRKYIDEKKQLSIKRNGEYALEEKELGIPTGIPTVSTEENRIEENRIEENRIEENRIKNTNIYSSGNEKITLSDEDLPFWGELWVMKQVMKMD